MALQVLIPYQRYVRILKWLTLALLAYVATALAQHLTEPGVEVDKLFRHVRDDVLDATGNKQEPFVYGSLPGRQDFDFRPN